MIVKISEKQLVSLIAGSITNMFNAMEPDSEFVIPANDKEIISVKKRNDKEILIKKEKKQQGDDILLID
jgi:CBS domain containing-hemolysin-like protein